jgi:short-subunit dehydrogenase
VTQRIADEARIALVVNNAGAVLNGGILDNDAETVARLLTLNVTAPTLIAQAAARAFLARGKGGLVNLASVLAIAPELADGVYSGTKAHVLTLTHGLAKLFAGTDVRVQAVLPGVTRTEIFDHTGQDVDQLFPAEMVMEVGDLVDAALTGFDRGETVTIPPLHDESLWTAYEAARLALAPHISRREPGARYRTAG